MKHYLILAGLVIFTMTNLAQDNQQCGDNDTAYTRVLIQRVDKFLTDIIDMEDSEKYIRVRNIIVKQYKGKINNYLSKEGYDLKKAEQEMRARQHEESE